MRPESVLTSRGPTRGGWATVQNQHFAVYAETLRWMDDGSCMSVDPELFFPEMGGATKQAKLICKGCPVRAECLDYALEHNEREGVWGGLSAINVGNYVRSKPHDNIRGSAILDQGEQDRHLLALDARSQQ